VEPEETDAAREQPINTFPWQKTHDTIIETVGNGVFYWVCPKAM
jgi:hypothetical protein